jgi:hypothetical protein
VKCGVYVDGISLPVKEFSGEGTMDSEDYFVIAGEKEFSFQYFIPETKRGTLPINAYAIDYKGQESSSSVNVQVKGDEPPSVYIIYPPNNFEVTAGKKVSVTVDATDDVGIKKVELYADGTLYGIKEKAPYNFVYLTSPLQRGSTIKFFARGYDTKGKVGKSSEVSIILKDDTTPPAISISSPKHGSVHPVTQDLLITVGGYDDAGIKRVEIFVNGKMRYAVDDPIDIEGGLPDFFITYIYPKTSTEFIPNTTLYLMARAYDLSGNMNQTEVISVELKEDSPPNISFISPPPNSTVIRGNSLFIDVGATDDVGVKKVKIFIDGNNKAELTQSPYQYMWKVPYHGDSYTAQIKAEAFDTNNNSSTAITYVNVISDTVPPVGKVVSPEGKVYKNSSVLIRGAFLDNVGVEKCNLYINGNLLSSSLKNEFDIFYCEKEYKFVEKGSYTIRISASDFAGNSATVVKNVDVISDEPPEVTILYPPNGYKIMEGEETIVKFSVSDDTGVKNIKVLSGGKQVWEKSAPSQGVLDVSNIFIIKIRGPSDASYPFIEVKAEDIYGNVGSASISLDVKDDSRNPEVEIIKPLSEEKIEVEEGKVVNFEIEARDNVYVAELNFVVDGTYYAQGSFQLLDERVEETTRPDPYSFGEIIVERTYIARYLGSLKVSSGLGR